MAAWLPFSLLHTSGKAGFRSGLQPRLPVSPGERTQEFIFMSSSLVQDVWTVGQMFIQVTQERTAEQNCVQQDRAGCSLPPWVAFPHLGEYSLLSRRLQDGNAQGGLGPTTHIINASRHGTSSILLSKRLDKTKKASREGPVVQT